MDKEFNLKESVRRDVENTPFSIIEDNKTKKCMIALANNIIDNTTFNNEKEATDYINSKPWKLIFNACALFTEYCIKANTVEETNINDNNKN